MTLNTRAARPHRKWAAAPAMALLMALALLATTPIADAQRHDYTEDLDDPRIGLRAGWMDAEEAASGLELLANRPRPAGFVDPSRPGEMEYANSDLAFSGDYVFVGNYNGFSVYDVSDPASPVLRTSVICPGGQGDLSVYGDLLFMSVEETRGRIDCGVVGAPLPVDPARFRGVRIFDISDLDQPTQVAAVQTCRGSHTHTLLADPKDPKNLYVYVSGASFVRPDAELPGCSQDRPEDDPETALFRIEVIKVPLAAPQEARVVSEPRIFADRETGDIAGLWPGGRHGEGTQRTAETNHCHDITVYPEIGLAAGACSGNGILLDISDPVNPVRIDEVSDPNFAYWHSATFNNDGTKVIFTDEWGGGGAPRCRATDPEEWGANAIFDIVDGRLQFAGYYKLPAPQTATENCVAHNGSLVPVPGRDIKVQAWYQGGISVFDFTDSANPVEIAFFDRGPMSKRELVMAGHWSAYWHNGHVYGSEIARGLDVLRLTPTEHLSQNEIDAALLVRFDEFNPQDQPQVTWPPHPVVAHAYLDQLERSQGLAPQRIAELRAHLARAGQDASARAQLGAFPAQLRAEAEAATAAGRAIDASRLNALAATLGDLVATRG
jgi:hypothetical protein